MISESNILAVQRAHAEFCRDAALGEIRRRWPNISEKCCQRHWTGYCWLR